MIIAGLGFRGTASLESLRDALMRARDAAGGLTGLTGQKVGLLATAQDKLEARCLVQLAVELGVPLQGIDPGLLRRIPTLTYSAFVHSVRDSGSVAEAAALAAARLRGVGQARLLGPRAISNDALATCALAALDLDGGTTS